MFFGTVKLKELTQYGAFTKASLTTELFFFPPMKHLERLELYIFGNTELNI